MLAPAKRFSQSAGFVELHVDDFVAALQARKVNSRVTTFICANRNRMFQTFEHVIGVGWKRLFDFAREEIRKL